MRQKKANASSLKKFVFSKFWIPFIVFPRELKKMGLEKSVCV